MASRARALATFAALACLGGALAPAASACLVNKTHHAFWLSPPSQPRADEVVLRVVFKARTMTALSDDRPYRTSCDGGAFVFTVTEVLHGGFAGKEIAIVHDMPGAFANAPKVGETRIVVGRLAPAEQFEPQYILLPHPERRMQHLTDVLVDYLRRTVGPAARLPVLETREPPETPLIAAAWIAPFLLTPDFSELRRWLR